MSHDILEYYGVSSLKELFDEVQGLVIDIGSWKVKLGFSGDDSPRTDFRNIYGKLKNPGITGGCIDMKDEFVGSEAIAKRGILKLFDPISCNNNDPINFKFLSKILYHTFYNEFRVTPEEHPILFTDFPLPHTRNGLSKFCSLLFEEFRPCALYFANSSVLSSFHYGKMSALVIESGHSITKSTIVQNGIPIGMKIQQSQNLSDDRISGNTVSNSLFSIFKEKYGMTTSSERQLIVDIKEKLGRVAIDDEMEKEDGRKIEKYILPDGSPLDIERKWMYESSEVLFHPTKYTNQEGVLGIHECVKSSLEGINDALKSYMLQNICLCGGTTLLHGYKERLKKELLSTFSVENTCNDDEMISISASEDRINSAWIGGSILTSLSSMYKNWVTFVDYEEFGPSVFLRKCPESIYEERVKNNFASSRHSFCDLQERVLFLLNEESSSSSHHKSFKIKLIGSQVFVNMKYLM